MGKKKTNQAQQTQRLQDVDDNFTDNNQTNRPSQKLTEEKVNRVHDIFPDWPKADIRRALEDSDYDEERVVQSHLQGGDSWQEVSKTKVKVCFFITSHTFNRKQYLDQRAEERLLALKILANASKEVLVLNVVAEVDAVENQWV